MNKAERRREMAAMIAVWRESGQSKVQFCKEQGIVRSKFQYWYARLKEQDRLDQSGFIPLFPQKGPAGDTLLEITYPNGVVLKVDRNDPALLAQLIRLY